MASFPARPFANTFNAHRALPERHAQASFGATTIGASRDQARFERDRAPRDGGAQHTQHTQTQAPASDAQSSLTDEQREEINEAFGLFDLDKDQRIDYHEFKVALKALGFDLPKADVLRLLTAHGQSSSPGPTGAAAAAVSQQQPTPPSRLYLTLPAFQGIAAELISKRHPRDEILRAFALFAPDNKGIIELEDLRRVARELGEGMDEEELVAMIEEFDLDGKGGVSREEFIAICMG